MMYRLMIEGARFRFRDESTRLFALTPKLRTLASYSLVLSRIEALVRGQGPLPDASRTVRSA